MTLKKGCAFAAWIYVPVYYNLGVTSINEYIDLRFGSMTRLVMTLIALIQGRVQTYQKLQTRTQLHPSALRLEVTHLNGSV